MTNDARSAATALFDLEPDAVRCPYPIFAALREQAPVAWFDELEAFVVSRYDLIVEVLRQPETFSSRNTTGPLVDRQVSATMRELVGEGPELGALLARRAEVGRGRVLVRADPPVHGRQRGLVNRAFSPGAIRELEPDIEALADSLVDRFVDRGSVEVMAELAVPLPMTVIANALGVELDRMDDFKRWSDGLVASVGNNGMDKAELTQVVRCRSELEEYLLGVMEQREAAPQRDLVSQIVHARVDGEQLSRHEILDMLVQFLLAGNETTAKLIASTALHLAVDPELADQMRAEPDRLGPFIEEVLRLEPPSSGLYRTATVDYELGGVTIPAGTSVWVVFAAGNRDPDHFEWPDRCHPGREHAPPHLGFGLGAHFCLGAGLARAEARIGVQALLTRCHDLRLEIDPAEVAYDRSYMVHGIQRLPLTFRSASA